MLNKYISIWSTYIQNFFFWKVFWFKKPRKLKLRKFWCTAYLVTPLNLVIVFWQTKCVTKSRVHCTYKIHILGTVDDFSSRKNVFTNKFVGFIFKLFFEFFPEFFLQNTYQSIIDFLWGFILCLFLLILTMLSKLAI